MNQHKDIHEAMLAIYGAVGYVQKQKSIELRYSYAGEAAFISELRPAMIENGVTVSVSKMDELAQESYSTARGTLMMRSTIHAVVTFRHVSGSSITVEAYGEGSDSGDKSVNKAMTDAYKYALRQTFMIETGDDPDKDASQERDTNDTKNHEKPKVAYQAKPGNGKMTLEFAQNETNSKGEKYGDLDTETLANMANALAKMAKRTDEQDRKLTAAQTILANRAASSGA